MAFIPKLSQGLLGLRGYHGSPYDFAAERLVRMPDGSEQYVVGAPDVLPDVPPGAEVLEDFPLGRFRDDKIGTGEGAQAYGYGHYLAEAPDAAKRYREALAYKAWNLGPEATKKGVELNAGARGEFMRQAWGNTDPVKAARGLQNANISTRSIAQETLEELFRDYYERGRGKMYAVDIPQDQVARMLDWDKPLSQQAVGSRMAVVKNEAPAFSDEKWLLNIGDTTINAYKTKRDAMVGLESATGQELLRALDAYGAKPGADRLRQEGIPGVRYLDGTSRGAGSGTSNFVVFDPKIIQIVKKYGIAGAALTLGMTEAEVAEAAGLPRGLMGLRAYHGSPHDFPAERLVRMPDGSEQYVVGKPDVLPDVPPGAEVVEDFPLGRFRDDKIGTGEGAQAYGHGHYLAEEPDVGRGYRDGPLFRDRQPSEMRVSGRNLEELYSSIERRAANMGIEKAQPEYDKLNLLELLGQDGDVLGVQARIARNPQDYSPEAVAWFNQEVAPNFSRRGHLYEVNVNAAPETFLDLDLPILEQSRAVTDALRKSGVLEAETPHTKVRKQAFEIMNELGLDEEPALIELEKRLNKQMSEALDAGNDALYDQLSDMDYAIREFWNSGAYTNEATAMSPNANAWFKEYEQSLAESSIAGATNQPKAADTLRQAGISGLKYMDQGSRGAGAGTRNYVVFDPKIIQIVKKYGIAGAATMLGLSEAEVAEAAQGAQAEAPPQFLPDLKAGIVNAGEAKATPRDPFRGAAADALSTLQKGLSYIPLPDILGGNVGAWMGQAPQAMDDLSYGYSPFQTEGPLASFGVRPSDAQGLADLLFMAPATKGGSALGNIATALRAARGPSRR